MKIQPTKLSDPTLRTALDDLSTHLTMVCVNHPQNQFSSKNPYIRSIFVLTQDCACPLSDLRVIEDGQEERMDKENSGRDIIAPESAVIVRQQSRMTSKIHRTIGKVVNTREHAGYIHYFVVLENGERKWFMEGLVFPVR